MIQMLKGAVESLKRISGDDYATVELHISSDYNVYYQVYTPSLGVQRNENFDALMDCVRKYFSPNQLLEHAKVLRHQADIVEEKAKQQQTQP